MNQDPIEYIVAEGHSMTEEQVQALKNSEEYLKKNKVMELFEVNFKYLQIYNRFS